MSLFDESSLVMIPSGYKEDVVYSVKPTDGSGDLTFTRASDGTRVNSQGLVERVPWNLLLQSNTFNTNWTAILGASISGGKSGYDGSNDAWEFTKASGQSSRIYQDITLSQTLHTTSIYAKAGTLRYLAILEFSGAFVYFDLQNGTSNTVSGSPIDVNIEAVGATGWYRCSITDDNDITQLRIYASDTNGSISGAGTIFLQDAQVNEGSTAKPYFPTTDRQNVPRLDYSNGCPSLLLEPQRTNDVFPSEDFSGYSGTAGTIVTNQATSPDGTTTADLLYPAITGNFAGKYKNVGATTTGVVSCFVKQAGKRYAIIGTDNNATYTCIFDLQTASVVYEATNYTGKIEAYSNGWYRISASYTSSTAAAYPFIGVADNSSGGVTIDGTNGLYVWGFQYERNASYATSYIPTTSASVTRVADAAYKTGISSLIGQTEGTLFLDFVFKGNPTSVDYSLMIIGSLSSNYIVIGGYNANLYGRVFNSTLQGTITALAMTAGTRYKVALAYANNDLTMYVNGVNKGVLTSLSIPTVSELGYQRTAYMHSDEINQAVIFKTRLTNDQLEYLTGDSYSTYAQMATALNYTIQ